MYTMHRAIHSCRPITDDNRNAIDRRSAPGRITRVLVVVYAALPHTEPATIGFTGMNMAVHLDHLSGLLLAMTADQDCLCSDVCNVAALDVECCSD